MMRPVTVELNGLGGYWDAEHWYPEGNDNFVEQYTPPAQDTWYPSTSSSSSSNSGGTNSSGGYDYSSLITTGASALTNILGTIFGGSKPNAASTQVVPVNTGNTGLTAAQVQQMLAAQAAAEAANKPNYTPYIIGGAALVGVLGLVLVLKK